jgi:REP element-mobilizing transposase RayT
MRVQRGVWNLRGRRAYRVVEQALGRGADRLGARLLRFSVMGNHIHMMLEARDRVALMAASKGLAVRIAKRINGLMGRRGRVFEDRYFSRVLRTPAEVRNVIRYIRDNYRKHFAPHEKGRFVDPCSSDYPGLRIFLPAPRTWLARVGWQRARAPARLAG